MTERFAQLEWHNKQPYSRIYGDVYFSSDSGLDETHYVFLEKNQLKWRWKNLKEDHFTIAETGFGTGFDAGFTTGVSTGALEGYDTGTVVGFGTGGADGVLVGAHPRNRNPALSASFEEESTPI